MTDKRRPLRPPEIRSPRTLRAPQAPLSPKPHGAGRTRIGRAGNGPGGPQTTAGPHPLGRAICNDREADAARAGFVTYLVSVATGIDAARSSASTRQSAQAARARQIAMYLAHVGFCWPMGRVGAAFGRDRSTASHACHRIEDLRDQPAFDAAIDTLEACIRAAPAERATTL